VSCRNKRFEALYLAGQISLELVPQGTLVERIRAHAAGIPAFFTPTGAYTAVEEGSIPVRYNEGGMQNGVKIPGMKKEAREFGGRRYILEPAIAGDVAFIRAWKVDEMGNCVFRFGTMLHLNAKGPSDVSYRYTSQNFSVVMAKNAKLTIVEVRLCVCALCCSGTSIPPSRQRA
jgi:3-oxoacid CoA-transferase